MDIKTRKSTNIFGLGSCINSDDKVITGVRLPTCRQVLRCLLSHLQEAENKIQKKQRWNCAKIVLDQVKTFYSKASIPILSESVCVQRILDLQEENEKIRKIPKVKRENPGVLVKVKKMNENLEKTFALWPKDAMEQIQDEDRAFLESIISNPMGMLNMI